MNFTFNARKATQVAALFITKEGGSLNIMKLVKLVYLLDRLSISKRGIPVLGGDYFSMKNGPVSSESLDLINSGELYGQPTDWSNFISSRQVHTVGLLADPGTDRLSESEMEFVNTIYAEHGRRDQFQLRDWCHENCAEWHPITQGRKEISVQNILDVAGWDQNEISFFIREAQVGAELDAMLA